MKRDLTTSVLLGAILAGATTLAVAALPQPTLNGVVVEDSTRSFSFDQIGTDFDTGPFVHEDAYQGTVRTMVIRALDNTYDFYFHFTITSGSLKDFSYRWQAPTSYTVAHHMTDPVLLWAGEGPAGWPPGYSESNVLGTSAFWCRDESCGGALHEGVLVLDTDAKAYASTASYRISDSYDSLQGNYSAQSPQFTTFGPAIPEPQTYALVLAGLGLLGLGHRLRQRR